MSDRLAELRRQRELVRQHLAWLDAEIARAESVQPEALRAPTSAGDSSTLLSQPSSPLPEVDGLLAAEADAPAKSAADVKRGCFLAFGLLMLLLGLAVTGLYFYSRSRH